MGNTPIDAQLNSRKPTPFAPAEDRATLGSDPSADWSPANGESGGLDLKATRLALAVPGTKAINPSVFELRQIALRIGADTNDYIPLGPDV